MLRVALGMQICLAGIQLSWKSQAGTLLQISCFDNSLWTVCQKISGWFRPGYGFTITNSLICPAQTKLGHLALIRDTW